MEHLVFDLSFSRRALDEQKSTAIRGTGIYFITKLPQREVIYLGLFRPLEGDIVTDRWARHLQTITWRGSRIGLGPAPKGRTPAKVQRRLDSLVAATSHPALKAIIRAAHTCDQEARFTSTGNDTSVNRTRFADEHWDEFSAATADSLLDSFAIDLIRTRPAADQRTAKTQIEEIERRLLKAYKPVCNSQFSVDVHAATRNRNVESILVPSIRQAMRDVTHHDASGRATLQPRAT